MEMAEKRAREIRAQLLAAFDIYKSNVQYGLEPETREEHQAITEWYQRMLSLPLEEGAYRESPAKIKRYLPQVK